MRIPLQVADLQEQEFEVGTVHFHKDYNLELPLANDIALIKIKPGANGRGIAFGDRVIPACLPPDNAIYSTDLSCTVTGWGSTGLGGSKGTAFSRFLQAARLPYIETSNCVEEHVYGTNRGSLSYLVRNWCFSTN